MIRSCGARAYVHNPKTVQRKLDPLCKKGILTPQAGVVCKKCSARKQLSQAVLASHLVALFKLYYLYPL